MITYYEAKYLKATGKRMYEKVTIEIKNKEVYINIRDFQFTEFKQALRMLQYIADNELVHEGGYKDELPLPTRSEY